jgi:thiol-disulfide isomerase/thioredoxin
MKNLLPLVLVPFLTCFATLRASEASHTKGAEPLHVSQGQQIDLADYLVPGKTTIFDFMSQYCGPCRAYSQPLATLHAKRDDIAVVKVDINRPDVKKIDWQSPVAQEFKLQSIPHFKVYGPDGKLIAEDGAERYDARVLVDKFLGEIGQVME